MGRFRQSALVVKGNYSRWKKDERIWFVFAVITILLVEYFVGFTRYSIDFGTKITPFMLPLVFGDGKIANGLLKILIYIGGLVLFSDAPFLDSRKPYIISRIGRRSWWLGECAYIWSVSFVYIFFVMIVTTLVVLPAVSVSDLWGGTIRDLLPAPIESVSYMRMYIPEVCKFVYPSAAQIYTLWSAWIGFSLLGMLIYLLGLYTSNSVAGLVVSMVLIALDPVLVGIAGARKIFIYFSPVSWTSLDNLDIVDVRNLMTIPHVVVISAILFCVLSFLIARKSRRLAITVNTLQ